MTPAALREPGKPTLKTIAQLSGLAVATVSRALNDAPDIGAATKVLVRRIADEIGYVPNRAGVRLRTGRTSVISLVLSTEHDMMNHTARLISGMAETLRGSRYHLIVTPFFPSDDPMKPIRYIVESGSADAVIFNQTQPRDPRVAYLMERSFPFATHGRTDWADRHAWFDFDNAVVAQVALRKLAARGRHDVLVIAPPATQSYGRHSRDSARAEAASLGLTLTVLGRDSDESIEVLRGAIDEALAERPGIDAILAFSPMAAMAAVAAAEAQGRRLGADIDIAGKEAVPFLQLFRPEMIVLREDVGRAGAFLAQAAIAAVQCPAASPMQELEVPQG
ncbi:LacI family transcriptional regulator [Pseudoroseicyclus aestuarii]|uniref:LacI family transcriptional regulator n=1 Tax=Pseudoroseicyclus aestuarii TaxID=1795041 RepID=UPI001FE33966|nr:LacI family transcriptional regulator [Pseudoroseicyclus aestuarii]